MRNAILLTAILSVLTACTSREVRDERPLSPAVGQIRAVVKSHNDEVKACYDEALSRDPELEGTLVFRYDIHWPGRAKNIRLATVGSTIEDTELEACVTGVIARMKFEGIKPGLVYEVTKYPYNFSTAKKIAKQ